MMQVQFHPKSTRMTVFPKAAFEIRNALLRGDMIVGSRYRVWHCDGVWYVRFNGELYKKPAPFGTYEINHLTDWMLKTDGLRASQTVIGTFGEVLTIASGVSCVDDFSTARKLAMRIANERQLATWDMARVCDEINPRLSQQFKWLDTAVAMVKIARISGHESKFMARVEQQRKLARYPELLEISRLHADDHVSLPPEVSLMMVAPHVQFLEVGSGASEAPED